VGNMDLEKKIDLVKSNTVEVVTEEELRQLLQKNDKPVAYCGYEPSGPVHIGHLVTIQKLVQMQEAGFKVKILLADWHAFLNRKGTWEEINKNADQWKKSFKKLGLEKAEYIMGTSFQHKREYLDDVMELAQSTTLKRTMRSMQEVARDFDNAHVSQMIYPLMQIVDLKHLGIETAQAGIEQRKIHMLARETLSKINYTSPVLVHTPLINALQESEGKMSSSIPGSIISVNDSKEEIINKMNKAFAEQGKTENNAVLDIVQLILFPMLGKLKIERQKKFGGDKVFKNFEELRQAYADNSLHPQDLKSAAGKALAKILSEAKS